MSVLAEATNNSGIFGPEFWGLVISALTTVLVGVLKIVQDRLAAQAAAGKPVPPPEPPVTTVGPTG